MPPTPADDLVVLARFRSELDAEHALLTLRSAGIDARAVGAWGQMLAPFNPTQTIDILTRRAAHPAGVRELERLAAELSSGPRSECAACGYSLAGLSVERCPECGRGLREARRGNQSWEIVPLAEPPKAVVRLGLALGYVALALLGVGAVGLLALLVASLAGLL